MLDLFSGSAEDLGRRAVAQPWTRNSPKLVGVNGPAPRNLPTTSPVKFLFQIWSARRIFLQIGLDLDLRLYRRFSAYRALDVFCHVRPSEISVVYSFLKLSA